MKKLNTVFVIIILIFVTCVTASAQKLRELPDSLVKLYTPLVKEADSIFEFRALDTKGIQWMTEVTKVRQKVLDSVYPELKGSKVFTIANYRANTDNSKWLRQDWMRIIKKGQKWYEMEDIMEVSYYSDIKILNTSRKIIEYSIITEGPKTWHSSGGLVKNKPTNKKLYSEKNNNDEQKNIIVTRQIKLFDTVSIVNIEKYNDTATVIVLKSTRNTIDTIIVYPMNVYRNNPNTPNESILDGDFSSSNNWLKARFTFQNDTTGVIVYSTKTTIIKTIIVDV